MGTMMRGDNARMMKLSEFYVHPLPPTYTMDNDEPPALLGIALPRTKTMEASWKYKVLKYYKIPNPFHKNNAYISHAMDTSQFDIDELNIGIYPKLIMQTHAKFK